MANPFEEIMKPQRLFKNRDALSPHYIPEELPFREEEIRALSTKLAPVLSGRKPENIFIYGKTGTGKTAVVKRVLSQLNEYAESRNLPVRGLYVNGRIHDTEYKVIMKLSRLLDPKKDYMGYSTSAIYDRIMERIDGEGMRLVVAVDEIDMVKETANLIYRLNRSNDELEKGSLSIIGISNNPSFKDRLDQRVRSTLCEVEMVFPPYDAQQLSVILEKRAKEAFQEGAITPEAISAAAALAAKHSGDARYALQLLLRAGDIAEEEGADRITATHVMDARQKVEEDIVYEMISTLPDQQKLVLLALATMISRGAGITSLTGGKVVTSGALYSYYKKVAEEYGMNPVSDRWFRDYLNELDTYGIISLEVSGRGFRGNTRIITLKVDPRRLLEVLRRSL